MSRRRSLQFCRSLHQVIGDDPLRWTTITAVADRLGIDQDKAEALAAELDERGLVRVGGGHSAKLTEARRRSVPQHSTVQLKVPRQLARVKLPNDVPD